MIKLTDKEGGVTIDVRVQPRAGRSEIVGALDRALKVRLAAPPIDGAANEELIKLLAKFFAVTRSQIAILSGATAKTKVIRIAGLDATTAAAKLAEVVKE